MVLRRFVSIRGYPSKLYSDNGTQLVAANKELKKVVKDLDSKSLQQFGVTQGLKWIFSSADAPWQNGISEALIKSVKIESNYISYWRKCDDIFGVADCLL